MKVKLLTTGGYLFTKGSVGKIVEATYHPESDNSIEYYGVTVKALGDLGADITGWELDEQDMEVIFNTFEVEVIEE